MTKQILQASTIILALVALLTTNMWAKGSSSTSVKSTTINTEKSTIDWIGKKVLGQHNGKVKIQSGTINTKNGVLTGGNFVIDMKSITNEDITDPDYNKKLIGHLNSEDFFNVAAFSTANVKITKVLKLTNKPNSYNLTADLTIKGITKSITFPATFSKSAGNGFEGNAKITIDRTLWDIKYGSSNFFEGLGDKAIKNEIELNVKLASN